jgi:endonuclease-3 related protein
MVGAVLAQNTSWSNVEKAIGNLKDKGLLKPKKLYSLKNVRLAKLIRPAGYYNLKAKRLKNLLRFFIQRYQGNMGKMALVEVKALRQELLKVNGIGPETADSILLYGLGKPVFVVDAYTKRILSRHGIIEAGMDYDGVQKIFMLGLRKDVRLFNEYHALLVKLGKDFCLKAKPRCLTCPLKLK